MTLTPPPIPPGFLTRWCDTLAEGSESPPGAFLPTGLAALSGIAGPRLMMRWGVAHEERMNLWILNVGMSALARKTSGLAGLRQAVRWVRSDGGDVLRLLNVARISDAGLVSSLDVVTEDTAKAQKTADGDHPRGPKNQAPQVEPVVRPVPMSWITLFNEVSPVWMEDGPGWAMDAQRALLAIYDGQLSSTTKATNVPSQDCFVTAIGNIPPGVLRDQTTLGMLSSGFVGRWLVIPTPAPTSIVSFPMPNGTDPLSRLRGEVQDLAQMASRDTSHTVNDLWTADALYLRDHWYTAHRDRLTDLSPDDPLAVAGAELFGRLQATAVKVATLIAVSRMGDSIEGLHRLKVNSDDVHWASQVIDASIDYITTTIRESGADTTSPAGKVEGRVLRYLERVGATSQQTAVTFRQVSDATKGGRVSHRDVIEAIDTLHASEHVVVQDAGRTRRVWLGAPE